MLHRILRIIPKKIPNRLEKQSKAEQAINWEINLYQYCVEATNFNNSNNKTTWSSHKHLMEEMRWYKYYCVHTNLSMGVGTSEREIIRDIFIARSTKTNIQWHELNSVYSKCVKAERKKVQIWYHMVFMKMHYKRKVIRICIYRTIHANSGQCSKKNRFSSGCMASHRCLSK